MQIMFIIITASAFAWLLLQLLARADFRRALKKSLRTRVYFFAMYLILCGFILIFVYGSDQIRWMLVIVSLALAFFLLIRIWPGYGRWWGLPPGMLAWFGQMDQVNDRFLLNESRKHGPVFKTMQTFQPTVCVVGIEAGAKLLREHDACLARGSMRFSALLPRGFLRFMKRSDHARYRPLLAKFISPEKVNQSFPVIVSAVRFELRRLETVCAADRQAGIVLHEHIPALMLRIFLLLFFGVEQNTGQMGRFEHLYRILNCRNLSRKQRAAAQRALNELMICAREQAAIKGCYLQKLVQQDPSLAEDPTLLGNIVCMAQLGSYDVASLVLWVWKYLSDYPQWQERLYTEAISAGEAGPGALAKCIISETLRLEQSEYVKRTAGESFHFAGFRIPKGWGIYLCLRESHQSPAVFASPAQFDPGRFLRQRFPHRAYAPFGYGRTRCIAYQLTYAVAGTLLHELVTRYTWTVLRDGPRMHDGIHWTPAKNFSVRLHTRTEAA